MLRSVWNALTRLFFSTRPDEHVAMLLQQLGAAVGVSRVYLFEQTLQHNQPGSTSQYDEWIAPSMRSQIAHLAREPFFLLESGFARWNRLLRRGEVVCGLTNTFPVSEQTWLQQRHICSCLVLPIMHRDWWGVLGFDDCVQDRIWSDDAIETLQSVAGMVGAVLQHQRRAAELQQKQARFEAVVQHSQEALFVKDLDGRYLLVNQYLAQLLEQEPQALIGQVAYDLFPSQVSTLSQLRDQQVLATGRSLRGEQVIDHDDGPHTYRESRFPLYNDDGQIIAIGVVANDITELKQAHERLLQQEQVLNLLREREHLDQKAHQTASSVLNDVHTQLQMVQQLLAGQTQPAVGVLLNELMQTTQDGLQNLEQILLLKQVHRLSSEPVQTHHFDRLRQSIEQFAAILQVHVDMMVDSDFPALNARIEANLLSIIQEALANVHRQANMATTRLTFSAHEGQLRVTIEDHGRGFDDTRLPRAEGSVYGLQRIRNQIKTLGGQVQIDTALGQGTRLIIDVPLLYDDEAGDTATMRLLLVDDSPLFLRGLHNLLEARGLTVVGTAHSGVHALEQARRLHPDVILMDVEMPNGNGIMATRLIKQELPDISIVMLSVVDDDTKIFEAIKNGASGYLLKSLDAETLWNLLLGIARGEAPLSPGLAVRVLREFAQQSNHEGSESAHRNEVGEALTTRQYEILSLVAQGLTYRKVSEIVSLSEVTVKYHMGEIVRRLQVKNRAEAIAYATRMGLLE